MEIKRCECELFVEAYYKIPDWFPVDGVIKTSYSELVNLLAMFKDNQKDNTSLLAQIEYMNQDAKKSHDRIMELEFQLKKALLNRNQGSFR